MIFLLHALYLLSSKYRVIDHNAIDSLFIVSLINLLFKVLLINLSKLEFDTSFCTSFCCPLSILDGSRVVVREKSYQLGSNTTTIDILLNLITIALQRIRRVAKRSYLIMVIDTYRKEADTLEAKTVLQDVTGADIVWGMTS